MNQDQIFLWIHSNFLYPHCLRANSLAHLKSGIAFAEILTECFPTSYHSMFLPHIAITNVSLDKSITNLKIVLQSIQKYISDRSLNINMKNVNAEGIYYRENQMCHFIQSVLMPLFEVSKDKCDEIEGLTTYPSTVAAHLMHQNPTNNISQLSQIGNSSCLAAEKSKPVAEEPLDQEYQIINIEQSEGDDQLDSEQIDELEDWICKKLNGVNLSYPHHVFGDLINTIFCDSRLKDKIIKQAHFEQGPTSIYRKGLHFILNNQAAEKTAKQNAINFLKSLEKKGKVNQRHYWLVINDLHQFQHTKKKNKKSKKTKIIQRQAPQKQKQNIEINRQASYKMLTKPSKKQIVKSQILFNYSQNYLKEAEKWISIQLGYEHSLNKSKKYDKIIENPLLNGSLVGSIIMRLKIGRPQIIKTPMNLKQVDKNWEQVSRICAHRGYQSLRKQNLVTNHTYKIYLGILADLHQEYMKFNGIQKNQERQKNCTTCDHKLLKKIELTDDLLNSKKKDLLEWLQNEHQISISKKQLTPQNLTTICMDLLNINLYRETTKKIQDNNMQKILGELRRIGLSAYYQISSSQILDPMDDSLRWKIVFDLHWMLAGRVQYCRN